MNTETGQVVSGESFAEMLATMTKEENAKWKPAPFATEGQMRIGKVGRNEKCPCGSGNKFKRCCMTPRELN